MDKKAKIIDWLKGLDDYEVVRLWNQYCDENNYFDDELYSMDDIDEIIPSMSPSEFFNRFDVGSFSISDSWFYTNGYGYFESVCNPFDIVDVESLADNIIEGSIRDSIEDENILELLNN